MSDTIPGLTINSIADQLRFEEHQKSLALMRPWEPPASNCPGHKAHHYISDGTILTCKNCGDSKQEVHPEYSYFKRAKARQKRA